MSTKCRGSPCGLEVQIELPEPGETNQCNPKSRHMLTRHQRQGSRSRTRTRTPFNFLNLLSNGNGQRRRGRRRRLGKRAVIPVPVFTRDYEQYSRAMSRMIREALQWNKFSSSFGLKNGLRFCFDSVTCLDYKFLRACTLVNGSLRHNERDGVGGVFNFC